MLLPLPGPFWSKNMNKANIIEALKQFDTANDAHWTNEGLIRLDVVQQKFPGLTRQMVTAVAPLFTRKNPKLPDLDAIREAAEKAALDADEAARVAEEKAVTAKRTATQVAKLEEPIRDAHTLTRANKGWLASQLEEDVKRAERQKALDVILSGAGGMQNVGAHPVERAIAQRVVAARKNIVVPAKKQAQEGKQ